MSVRAASFTLHAGGVRLRDFRSEDIGAVHAIAADDRVTQWLSFDSRDIAGSQRMLDSAIATARVEPRTEYYLGITPSAADEVIGFVRLAFGGVQAAKLGYAIHADHWGRGYATHAARAMIGYGFGSLGLHRITAAVGPDNKPSLAVLDHLGFAYEGRLRDHVFTNNAWRDSLLYSVLGNEWSHASV